MEVIKAILFTPVHFNLASILLLALVSAVALYFIVLRPLRTELLEADLAIKLLTKKQREHLEDMRAYTQTRVADSQVRLLKSLEKKLDSKLKEHQAKRRR